MLQILILVCSTSLSSVECQIDTAHDVINGPQVASVFACGLQGQSLLARTATLGRSRNDFVKIVCKPVRDVVKKA
jgi:hypothetical protein